MLRFWCWTGRVFGLLAGSPCGTVSRARRRPNVPPPLCPRHHLFRRPNLFGAKCLQRDRGTELFLRCCDLLEGVFWCGAEVLSETHPIPRSHPIPVVGSRGRGNVCNGFLILTVVLGINACLGVSL